MACAIVSDADYKKFMKLAKNLAISTDGLTKTDLMAALSVMIETGALNPEFTMKDVAENLGTITQIISDWMNQAKERNANVQKLPVLSGKLGNASIIFNDRPIKTDPQNNSDSLFLIDINTQVYQALNPEHIVEIEDVIIPENGVTIHTQEGSLHLVTNTNGEVNQNVIGFVTRKNAENKIGKWISRKEIDKIIFRDSDLEAFRTMNQAVIDKILEIVNSPETKNVHIPKYIGIDVFKGKDKKKMAYMPKQFAETLAKMLWENLHIATQLVKSDFNENLYGLEVQLDNKGKKSKSAASKDALESLNAERPTKTPVDTAKLQANVLKMQFPNIAERHARINLIANMFTRQLDVEVTRHQEETTSKTFEGKRREVLGLTDEQGRSVSLKIVDDIHTLINMIGSLPLTEENIETVINSIIKNPKTIFGMEYELESAVHDVDVKTLRNRAIKIMDFCSKVANTPNLFEGLLNAACEVIERDESIKLSMDKSRVLLNEGESEDMSENDEGVENRSDTYLVKSKVINPKTTLTFEVKRMLGRLYKVDTVIVDSDGVRYPVYAYNDLGMRVKINPGVAYYNILKRVSTICNTPEYRNVNGNTEYDDMLDKLAIEYPWFIETANELKANQDLKNAFFRCFRLTLTTFAVVTREGKVQFKNLGMDAAAFLDMLSMNYEGGNLLSATSLYDIDGMINMESVKYFRSLLFKNKEKKNEEIISLHPLSFAHSILSDRSPLWNVENAQIVHKILKGENIDESTGEKNYDTSLENILLSIGIDTTDLDLEALLPDINWDEIITLNDIDKVWNRDARKKLYNILSTMQIIVDNKHGLTKNSNLLNDYRSSLLNIANALTGLSENYSESSFYFGGKTRYCYTHPDAISNIVNTIRLSQPEVVQRFLENRYLKYDMFSTSPLLHTFDEDADSRKKFMRIEVLAVQTGKGNDSIGKVKDKQFLTGLIASYWRGGSVLSKTSLETKYFGWFRNPLFSDTESLNLFRLPRITGENYDAKIIDNLMTVAEAEIERIVANEANSDGSIKVDNYNIGNNNASKFCFLPFLNMNQVIETVGKDGRKVSEPMSLAEAKNKVEELKRSNPEGVYIIKNELISILQRTGVMPRDIIRMRIQQMLAEGFNDFMHFVDDLGIDKPKLLSMIKNGMQENAQENENNEQNIDDTIFDNAFVIDDDSLEDNDETQTIDKTSEEELNDFLREFYYNDYYMQSQLIMMFGGDLAYYKNIRDFIKRNKQSYASGERVFAFNEDGTPMVERAVYLKDKKVISNSYEDIKEMLYTADLSTFEREMMLGSLEALTSINSTDGFAYRTPKSFKKIYKAMGGMWTDEVENAFQNIENGNMSVEDFVALVNQIKPFLFTYEEKTINGRLERIPVQHKNSEYMLSALFSTLNTVFNKSPELKALQRFAELHDIDCFQFMSCVKEGGFCPLDLNYAEASYKGDGKFDSFLNKQKKSLVKGEILQEEFNKILSDYSFVESDDSSTNELENLIRQRNSYTLDMYIKKLKEYQQKHPKDALVTLELQMQNQLEDNVVHVLPMEDYIIAQPSSDHLTGAKAIIGSQGRNIITADLSPLFETTMSFGGHNVYFTREQIRYMFDVLFADQVLEEHHKLDTDFRDIRRTKARLEAAMEDNPKYSGEIRKAFELNEMGTDFVMPMNNPIMNNKGQELILSQFKNHIQKMFIDGGNATLISNFALSHGFHDELHVHYKYVTDSKGVTHKAVDYVPCYLPAYLKDMYVDYLIEQTDSKGYTMYYLDIDRMKADGVDESLFNMIGYRIPTEDKYSMIPLRIIGFLPIQAGGSIMLPSDIVALSGSDFDIDKLFLMRKSFIREVAPKNLGLIFLDWLEKKGKKRNDKFMGRLVDYRKDSETNEKYDLAKPIGFTKEDILYLYDHYEDFAEFWDSGDYAYEHPKYIPLQPKLITDASGNLDVTATSKMSDVYSFETRKMLRNNMIMDIYWGILTSVEGSRMMMTSASYETAKASSRQEIIRNSPILLKAFKEKYEKAINQYGSVYEALNHFGDIVGVGNNTAALRKALESFIEEYSLEDNPCDIKFYVQTHRNLMDGNGLIGGFAVNSSRHYKFQLFETKDDDGQVHSGLSLDDNHKFKIKIPKYGEFTINEIDPRISPITGISISKINSEFQSASPDNGKDPLLGDMGINMSSLSRTSFMASIGLPIELIGFLNRCLPLYYKGNKLLGKRGSKSRRKFMKSFKLIDFVLDVEKLDDIHQRFILDEPITEKSEDKDFLKKFALWWENLNECAQDLNLCSIFVRSDSPNGALEVLASDALIQLLTIDHLKRKMANGAFSIKGIDKLIDLNLTITDMSEDEFRNEILNKPIPRMQAYFSCGIANAVNLVSKYIPELSQPMLEQLLNLQFLTGVDLTNKNSISILRTYLNEYAKYALSAASFLFTDNLLQERNFYIHDFPMKYKKFLNSKNSRNKYVHPEVRAMALFRMITNLSKKGLKFKNVGGKISIESREGFTESLDRLLVMDDETQEFGVDTFKYAYYDHGLSFGASNYGIFYSLDFINSLNGFADTLNGGNKRVLAGDNSFLENYTMQFLLNHVSLITRGPEEGINVVFSNDYNSLTINMNGLEDEKQAIIREFNPSTETVEFKKLLKFTHKEKNDKNEDILVTEVYTLVNGDDPSSVLYERVGFNNSGVSFYDCLHYFNQIAWQELKGRGLVINIKEDPKQSKSENSDMNAPTEQEFIAPSEPTGNENSVNGFNIEKEQADWTSSVTTLPVITDSYDAETSMILSAKSFKSLEDSPSTEEMCIKIGKSK